MSCNERASISSPRDFDDTAQAGSSTISTWTTPPAIRAIMRESRIFNRNVIEEIHRAAEEGIYKIRGFGAKRDLPHFDDLLVLGASMSRYPLEGYRERCSTEVFL